MNYLAHFHLAQSEPALVAGALLGDYVKGPLKGVLPANVERGIVLHRKIDAFTDEYALTQQLHTLFPSKYRRCSGIMLDLYFDHLLARDWHDYEQEPLTQFSSRVQANLDDYEQLLPAAAKGFKQRLQQYDLLSRYAQPTTIDRTLQHIAGKLRAPNPLASAMQHLIARDEELTAVFKVFYPALQRFSSAQ
ncbi:MAG: ACP phosphodiesterase [Pseudomonadales bacterium]